MLTREKLNYEGDKCMYKSEMDRLNKKIDEETISLSAKRALHDIVEEFFSPNYQNISEEWKNKVENKFNIKKYEKVILECNIRNRGKVDDIFSQIETSLFTILDQSVDKTRKSKPEKILSSIPIKEIHLHSP